MYTVLYVSMYTVCLHAHVLYNYVCVYIYVYIYTHIHMHIHIKLNLINLDSCKAIKQEGVKDNIHITTELETL